MKLYLINRQHRRSVHFYHQHETGLKIKIVFDAPAFNAYQNIFSLKNGDKINILSIGGSYEMKPIYNLYKNCEILYIALKTNNYAENFLMILCEKIDNNLTEQEAVVITRKQKLEKIKNL